MDINSIRDQVSNLTLYDLKAGVRKVQNAVMNYTEMEAKVREATNNEPWGASTTLMQEVASGTYSYQLLNEIMPMIYKRFTEKSAEEWRQIYKSLQLLEFLVKNGSERVIDDARSHLSLLKMLRQFHYLDQNGKDQGINVRNRAKELAELLSDVERIRTERKKARANRNKTGGVEGGIGFSSGLGGGIGGLSGGSRLGGFGSEDAGYGGYTGRTYGDGGGFGGDTSSFQDSGRRDKFEEYDEGDDPSSPVRSTPHSSTSAAASKGKKVETKKEPEEDLFDFGDDEPAPAPASAALSSFSNGKQPLSVADEDDDFGDFNSAAPSTTAASTATAPSLSNIPPPAAMSTVSSTTPFAAPKPVSANQGANLSGLAALSSMSPAPAQPAVQQPPSMTATPSSTFSSPPTLTQTTFNPSTQPPRPTGYQASQPNYFTSVLASNNSSGASPANANKPAGMGGARPGPTSTGSFTGAKPAAAAKPKAAGGGDAFSGLWSSASASAGVKKATPAQGPNLASLAKEKTSAGIWGPAGGAAGAPKPAAPPQQQQQQPAQGGPPQQSLGGGLDDLLG